MTWWPSSLGARLTIALAGAALAIAGLDFCVERRDATRAGPRTPASRNVAPTARGLGFVLAPCDGTVLLAAHLASIGPGVAPVVQVLADGGLVLRRPAPLPRGPVPVRRGNGAAVVLPAASLDALTAAARGALVDVIAQLVAARPVAAGQLRAVDLQASAAQLAALSSWVP